MPDVSQLTTSVLWKPSDCIGTDNDAPVRIPIEVLASPNAWTRAPRRTDMPPIALVRSEL